MPKHAPVPADGTRVRFANAEERDALVQPDGELAPWRPPLVSALDQFVLNLRVFHELFDVPAVCDRELLLRSEMRRTMTELAAALREAADKEPIGRMATLYRNAAVKAAQLANGAPPPRRH